MTATSRRDEALQLPEALPRHSARTGSPRLSGRVFGLLLGAAESVALAFVIGIALHIFGPFPGMASADYWALVVSGGVVPAVSFLFLSFVFGVYSLSSILAPGRALAATFFCAVVTLGIVFFEAGSYHYVTFDRAQSVLFVATFFASIVVIKAVSAQVTDFSVARGLVLPAPVIVVTDAKEPDSISASNLLYQHGRREVGRVAFGGDADLREAVDAALDTARSRDASALLFVLKSTRAVALAQIKDLMRMSPVPAEIVAAGAVALSSGRRFAAEPVHSVQLQRAPIRSYGRLVKRAVDFAGSLVGILILLPIFVMVSVAIKLDSEGPIVFRQRRNGCDGRQFVIFKFRSMRVLEDGHSAVQASRGDSRVTAVGRFLRRTSIDELPQLFNVLLGDMSLVGPRPHPLALDEAFFPKVTDYWKRYHGKPGITGWAQINGSRGETAKPDDMQRRVEYDLWYLRNWSPWLDFYILGRTCLDVARHDAY